MRVLALLMVFLTMQQIQSIAEDPVPRPAKKPSQSNDAGLFDLTKSLLTIKKAGSEDGSLPIPNKKPKLKDSKPINYGKSLSKKDVELYGHIFALQSSGKIEAADKAIAKLNDKRLYGYVLQQRYLHPTAYTSSFNELRVWLNKYADHPGAHRIYDLAERKRPAGNRAILKQPQTKIKIIRRGEPTMRAAKFYVSSRNRSIAEAQKVQAMQKKIIQKVHNGQPEIALEILNQSEKSSIFDSIEYDIMNAKIAAGMLYQNKTDKALSLASKSAERSGLHVPLASWVAGLISWQREKYSKSASYFESVGRSNYASSWTRSAGSYWAARAHMRRGDVRSVSTWLRRASASPRTFYGLIATRALGEDFDFSWSIPTFTKENHKILSSNTRGARAIALSQIGQISKAQAELLRINADQTPEMRSALVAFAGYARLPGLAMRLGASPANKGEERYYDAALYPLGPWKPKNGYKLNAALLHAVMRQESRFDPDAESRSGAKGLMQLMPATAKSLTDADTTNIEDPAVNLELGQRYLQQLLKSPRVDNNLLSLLIAYNAGPGNLAKWRKQWSKVSDPLLFIELLPSSETRQYVERVLSNYWIYRLRDKQSTPTLDAVVAGTPVEYATAQSVGIRTASAK